MNNRTDRKQCGFTLLEVMIAISIMAIALTALLGNQSQSLRIAEESRFALTASLLMKQKFADFQLSSEQLYNTEGDFGEDYPGYFWSVEVDVPDFENVQALYGTEQFLQRVDLKIYTDEERHTLLMSRYILTGLVR